MFALLETSLMEIRMQKKTPSLMFLSCMQGQMARLKIYTKMPYGYIQSTFLIPVWNVIPPSSKYYEQDDRKWRQAGATVGKVSMAKVTMKMQTYANIKKMNQIL